VIFYYIKNFILKIGAIVEAITKLFDVNLTKFQKIMKLNLYLKDTDFNIAFNNITVRFLLHNIQDSTSNFSLIIVTWMRLWNKKFMNKYEDWFFRNSAAIHFSRFFIIVLNCLIFLASLRNKQNNLKINKNKYLIRLISELKFKSSN